MQAYTYSQVSLAVGAPEAVLVVGDPVSREQVHDMDGLVASLALVLSSAERHCESRSIRLFSAVEESRQKAKLGKEGGMS